MPVAHLQIKYKASAARMNEATSKSTPMPYPFGLLCSRRKRPSRRAAEQRDELAPSHHSITSSVRPDRGSGTVMPSALRS
jgi:hypothetical protein